MLASEQLYELTIPAFSEITLPTFKGFGDDHLGFNYMRLDSIDHIFKPEYLKLYGLDWCKLSYFKKTDFSGALHSDAVIPEDHMFGINWIDGGDGILEFYDHDEVEIDGITGGALNKDNWGVVTKYKPIRAPSKRYEMKKNKAYLINASTIHRAIGIGPRKCYSLRTNDRKIPWDDIVKLFNNLIVK
jgi:hypothetical protein